jgi:hypothetical protein
MSSAGRCDAAGVPAGFFNYSGLTYYSNGQNQYCLYSIYSSTAPVYQFVPAVMSGGAECAGMSIPSGLFNYHGVTYASNGQNQYCLYDLATPGAQSYQLIPQGMTGGSQCAGRPAIPQGQFNFNGAGYYANNIAQYCKLGAPIAGAPVYQFIPKPPMSGGQNCN